MKSGNLNFLEPSGPLQTCNGTALLLYIYIYYKVGLKMESPVVSSMQILFLREI